MTPPVLYRDMLDVAFTALSEHGLDGDKATTIANRIAAGFCSRHGEKYYRVPTLQGINHAVRNETIREQRKTMSVAQIAKRHGVSEWVVREVLRGGE